MKILLVNTFYYPSMIGGAEFSCKLLCEELAKNGNDVTVACLHKNDRIVEEFINGVRVVRFPLKNLYWFGDNKYKWLSLFWHLIDIFNFKMKRSLASYFANDVYDIVHTNNLKGFSVAVWSWAKSRDFHVVHTLRDYYLINPNSTMYSKGKNQKAGSFKTLLFSFLKKYHSHKVSHVVGVSKYINDLHIENGFFKNSKKITIYNGVDIDGGDFYKEKEYTDNGILRFGYLGYLDERKGVNVLLNEFKRASESNNKIKLFLGGSGDSTYVELLKSMSKSNVFFCGNVEPTLFFKSIDFLIVPSIWNEPMGRVVVEAYSCGVPVIVSSTGGLPELIVENLTGFVFDLNDPHSLSDIINKICGLSGTSYLKLRERSYQESKFYRNDLVTSKYLAIYNKI